MSGAPSENAFFASLPVFSEFRQIADPRAYLPLPDDWVVGLADVVSSTHAIEAGRYKAVNMAGAAVIAAVSNAIGQARFPFVFGGDGASFAVPPEWLEAARGALAATATLVAEEFELDLRIAEVSVRTIREAGHDVSVALFAASPNVAYAMFSGGGLLWAEERMKAGDFALSKAPPGARPDLSGLSCRFDETPAQRGVVLSLIVRPTPDGDPWAYTGLVGEILRLVETSPEMARPVPDAGPPFAWLGPGLELEARSSRRPGSSLWLKRLSLLVWAGFAALILRYRLRLGRFDPNRYMDQLVANTDYRKYDDGLRMTIDCSLDLADAIEARLARAAADGVAIYGTHRQGAALMTCITPSVHQSDHIHFVDGAAGGYAAAAASLKG